MGRRGPYQEAVIERLLEHPRLHDAAIIASVFGGYPDEALDCDPRRWQMRVAGARYLHSLRPTT